MGLTAFFVNDAMSRSKDPVTLLGSAMAIGNPYAPPRNALDDRPRVVWMNGDGAFAPSGNSNNAFEVYIDIAEGGGSTYQTSGFTLNAYTALGFAARIQAQLNANASLSLTYTVVYDQTSNRFTISASGSFEIKWKTGTSGSDNNDNNLSPWLGFSDAHDTGTGTSFTGASKRFDTELNIMIKADKLKTMAPALWATILQGDESDDPSGGSDYSDVKVYGASSPQGFNRRFWELSSTYKLTFSARPGEAENKIQIAYHSGAGAMSADWWFFSWRYFDESNNHGCGILKALDKLTTTDRQITELANHGLVDPTTPLGIKSYYPVQNLLRWRTPLNFNSWGATDYRNVVQEVVRKGKARGLLWALRYDEIVDGTYDADDEADKGFLLWAAIQSYSQESYQGRGTSEFISGELTIEQVR